MMNITMKPLRYFYCPYIPTNDDIVEAMKVVKNNDCYVQINYTGPGGYSYSVGVCPGDTHQDVLNRIPTVFGL